MPRIGLPFAGDSAFVSGNDLASDQDRLDAFHQRQRHDLMRFDRGDSRTIHRQMSHKDETDYSQQEDTDNDLVSSSTTSTGHGWLNSEGDRLDDFGVDEDVDFCGDDEIPLAELLRRNKAKPGNSQSSNCQS